MSLTREQLLALPEVKDYRDEILNTQEMVEEANARSPQWAPHKLGDTYRHRIVLNFVGHKPSGDDVIMFRDDDGKSWFVVYHLEGGPYKRRALL